MLMIQQPHIKCKSPYSVRIQENTEEKNSEQGHFSRSATTCNTSLDCYRLPKAKNCAGFLIVFNVTRNYCIKYYCSCQ